MRDSKELAIGANGSECEQCATLLLQAGQPVHVVSERLGHSKVSMTMDVYAHVLPDMQQDAAAKLGVLLHG
jgi:integrase